MKRLVVVVVSALVLVSPLAASINPTDQGYAVRFSLKLRRPRLRVEEHAAQVHQTPQKHVSLRPKDRSRHIRLQ